MSRPRKLQPRAREPRWLRRLADRVRCLAVAQSARGVEREVRRAAEQHGVRPWELTRRIARLWREQGHIETLQAGERL